MLAKIKQYFKEVKTEFKHVNWLSKEEAIKYTLLVIGFSVSISIFLGLFDFIFSQALSRFIL
jgi:preprotein translocase SecE subunit